jgi:ATP-dependent DNA helicase RecG
MDTILERIKEGDQCYVVCPSIDQSTLNIRNVKDIYDQLNKRYGKQIKIEMIHGQLSSDEINEILKRFKQQKIDMLVTTTVIEVGIHVASANTMVIYDADRFGLAQIHQLRGRIGRENHEGLCYLLTDSTDQQSLQRLEYLNETSDGFELAYFDLKMRGTGDLLGERQSGIPSFLLSDIIKDEKILKQAKEDAEVLLQKDDTEAIEYVEAIEKRMESILIQAAI